MDDKELEPIAGLNSFLSAGVQVPSIWLGLIATCNSEYGTPNCAKYERKTLQLGSMQNGMEMETFHGKWRLIGNLTFLVLDRKEGT